MAKRAQGKPVSKTEALARAILVTQGYGPAQVQAFLGRAAPSGSPLDQARRQARVAVAREAQLERAMKAARGAVRQSDRGKVLLVDYRGRRVDPSSPRAAKVKLYAVEVPSVRGQRLRVLNPSDSRTRDVAARGRQSTGVPRPLKFGSFRNFVEASGPQTARQFYDLRRAYAEAWMARVKKRPPPGAKEAMSPLAIRAVSKGRRAGDVDAPEKQMAAKLQGLYNLTAETSSWSLDAEAVVRMPDGSEIRVPFAVENMRSNEFHRRAKGVWKLDAQKSGLSFGAYLSKALYAALGQALAASGLVSSASARRIRREPFNKGRSKKPLREIKRGPDAGELVPWEGVGLAVGQIVSLTFTPRFTV